MSRFFTLVLALCLWCGALTAQDTGLARLTGGVIEDRRQGATEIELTLSQGVPWRLFTLTDPDRLVLDFAEVDWQGADPEEIDQSDRIAALRMGLFRPGWSRLVAELAAPMAVERAEMRVTPDGAGATLALRLISTDADSFVAAAGQPADPTWVQTRPKARRVVADPDRPLTIVLDPGHGGIDPGARRDGVSEADLMLLFAKELREVLLRAGDYRVVLTRQEDQFVSLEARVKLAHDAGADLFISLHADALSEGVAHGAAVYTLAEEASDAASAALAERHDRDDLLAGLDLSGTDDRVAQILMDLARLDNTPRSQALAGHIIGGIESSLGHVHKDPLRQAAFSVLKSADIPSVLLELGFLSTEADLRSLQDPAWRAGMAAGIRDGLAAWLVEDAALSGLRRQ
ncbi:N-acetylmuramoyl-L-alanine amidase AmiA [Antarctobacter heliothermus]|uniref:N-acetylmuramoyl-L-alanine amidase n=1 Tax=Antarctobacter heliothermus TaxID=74033 RepID=A0A222E6N5_9RHOB|nr:N-acetylmuramoyl-L-alanine amidase [Antarctobacter heliothermus]ASP21867.1 N-acetylmuramoyl-L-alanine amidase AmiA [Antarctobacter heliothermus]